MLKMEPIVKISNGNKSLSVEHNLSSDEDLYDVLMSTLGSIISRDFKFMVGDGEDDKEILTIFGGDDVPVIQSDIDVENCIYLISSAIGTHAAVRGDVYDYCNLYG